MKKNLILGALLVAGSLPLTAMAADPAEGIAQKAGCLACHAKDKKLVGPAFKDIATKYQGDAAAPAKLADKVRKGGSGVWGPIPMPPNGPEKIADPDLKSVVAWILKGAV